ncbi:DUF327 family protein [Entomospira entomophila]|uniref:YaaR family protein n=1 Tax=Entomospira entomophila TaxID=2719988 RepID=A0A968GCX0_9SPIO|nr:DUF327 family protein [Entomospira entomophilus]NIZ40659.1 YaaR family protein [Entomospira entomophilus]WDI34873.1 DUF327 family protein [Entomospira entomophilus]
MAKVSVASEFSGLVFSNEIVEKKRNTRVTTSKRHNFSEFIEASMNGSEVLENDAIVDDSLLEKAMDDVFILGERLKHDYMLSCLDDYRCAVKNFLEIIRKRAYAHDRVKGRIDRHSMMQKEYNLVRVVDEKLDRLAKAVLVEQRDMIYILSRIDEIRGLIINYVW